MYCDKDSNGRVSIMDLTNDEFDTIRRAIMAFKTGLLQNRLPAGFAPQSETYEQYHRAGIILRQIEQSGGGVRGGPSKTRKDDTSRNNTTAQRPRHSPGTPGRGARTETGRHSLRVLLSLSWRENTLVQSIDHPGNRTLLRVRQNMGTDLLRHGTVRDELCRSVPPPRQPL